MCSLPIFLLAACGVPCCSTHPPIYCVLWKQNAKLENKGCRTMDDDPQGRHNNEMGRQGGNKGEWMGKGAGVGGTGYREQVGEFRFW